MGEQRDGMFEDRSDAGRRLARVLGRFARPGTVVLGLPRGGLPVAAEVAEVLGAQLDVVVVRKLGVPDRPEVAMGAIAEEGVEILDRALIARLGITSEQVDAVRRTESTVLAERVRRLRRLRPPVDLTGRTALIVDDGVATGATAAAACARVRRLGASEIVLAVPVAPAELVSRRAPLGPDTGDRGDTEPDEIVSVVAPRDLVAVGRHYRGFSPTSEEQVEELLMGQDRAEPE